VSAQPALSAVKAARHSRILDAAESVFVSSGFRGASVEQIAAAAGMSKVTVYGYFADKDALFAGVAIRVADRIYDSVADAMAITGALHDRIASALIGKHALVHSLVRQSAFAADLFSAKNRIVADRFQRLDADIRALFAAAIRDDGWPSDQAAGLSRLVFAMADGIARHAAHRDEMAHDIAKAVNAQLAR
jgi:AcrR family transcriptional regulator